MAYLNEFYKPEIEFLQKKNEIINFIDKTRSDAIIRFIDDIRLRASHIAKTIPLNQLHKNDLYINLSFEVESLIIKGMYEAIKKSNTNADNIVFYIFLNEKSAPEKHKIQRKLLRTLKQIHFSEIKGNMGYRGLLFIQEFRGKF